MSKGIDSVRTSRNRGIVRGRASLAKGAPDDKVRRSPAEQAGTAAGQDQNRIRRGPLNGRSNTGHPGGIPRDSQLRILPGVAGGAFARTRSISSSGGCPAGFAAPDILGEGGVAVLARWRGAHPRISAR